MMRKSYRVGTPQEVAADLRPYVEAGANWVTPIDFSGLTRPLEESDQVLNERSSSAAS